MAEFTMPSLGADMDEGTLLEWLVGPGDLVHKGDPVAVVETAKSTIEVECFETGTMAELLVEPGTTVPVGTPLALIGAPARKPEHPAGEEKPHTTPEARSARRPEVPAETEKAAKRRAARRARRKGEPARPPSPPLEPATVQAPVLTTARQEAHTEAGPLIRHLAEQSGVDLETLHGSGPGGRVTRADVEEAAGARRPRLRVTPSPGVWRPKWASIWPRCAGRAKARPFVPRMYAGRPPAPRPCPLPRRPAPPRHVRPRCLDRRTGVQPCGGRSRD